MINQSADTFTFKGRILCRTEHGAYRIQDDSGHSTFVPITWVTVAPETFDIGQSVEITLSRSLARQKGFLRENGPDQGRLL